MDDSHHFPESNPSRRECFTVTISYNTIPWRIETFIKANLSGYDGLKLKICTTYEKFMLMESPVCYKDQWNRYTRNSRHGEPGLVQRSVR